ncbi:MAG: ribonuclease P protein component [Acidimicrobiales bacterium]
MSDRATFTRLRRSGRLVRRGPVTVTWVRSETSEPTRVAYTVGRRVGGAVVRNRVRRRLRAATREAGAVLRPGPYLLGVGPEASRSSYAELRAAVHEALTAVAGAQTRPLRAPLGPDARPTP